MIKRPLYLEKIKPYIDQPLIKVLVGMRRAGKSSLLEQVRSFLMEQGVAEEKILHVNFERVPYLKIKTKDDFIEFAQEIIEADEKRYLLFDEIQNIEGWDEVINGLLAEGKFDIYVTGSNSKLLSSELSTYLTGRFVDIRVNTLTFREYLDFKGGMKPEEKLSEVFQEYLDRGGFPILHAGKTYTLDECDSIVSDIYASVIFRDLVERKEIRNTELLSRVVSYAFDNIGNIFSAKAVTDYLKNERRTLGVETVYNYLDWLEEAFVIERVQRYDLRGKALLKTQEKYFLGDVGLLYAVNGRRISYLSGILENVVYHELTARGYTVKVGKNKDKEIDFVAERGQEKIYVQVTAHITERGTMEREYAAFEGIEDNCPKLVLTMDEGWGEERNGVEQKYLPEWLLEG